jgi:hypothetical protein
MAGHDEEKATGFVPLASLRKRRSDPAAILQAIREVYFSATQRTIQKDLERAIELLKELPTEDEQEKARVYMDGLAQMRSDWARQAKKRTRGRGPGPP